MVINQLLQLVWQYYLDFWVVFQLDIFALFEVLMTQQGILPDYKMNTDSQDIAHTFPINKQTTNFIF